MKAGIYIRKEELKHDPRYAELIGSLSEAGCECYQVGSKDELQPQTDLILAVGGDGTFLSASIVAADTGIPVMGANLGRLGFLSENRWQAVGAALASGDYTVENRTILHSCISACTGVGAVDNWPYALNEVCVHRTGASMLAVDVTIDGTTLPTYWADGLLVATSSGSTAYSLSVGGPIVLSESKVLIISPISPHNLNVRPLIVPDTTEVRLKFHTRDSKLMLTLDNRSAEIDPSFEVDVKMAQFSLKRLRLNTSNFIDALTGKLFWGEDIRNDIKDI
jgi:NAD+ kinase